MRFPQHLKTDTLFILVFAGSILLIYGGSIYYDYTYMDDHQLILKNWAILSDFSRMPEIFQEDVFFNAEDAYYRPMLALSFWLDAQWHSQGLVVFHITNLLLHWICCILVFYLLKGMKYGKMTAGLCTLIFAVHPMLTQAVAWVPGRNDSLLAIFVLLSFHALIKFSNSGNPLFLIGHHLFFLAALFTKETVILYLVICIVYLWLFYREQLTKYRVWAVVCGWFAAILIYLFLRMHAMVHPIPVDFSYLFRSLFIGAPGVLQYLGKMILPVNLSVLPTMIDTGFFWSGLGVVVLVTIVLWRYKKMDSRTLVFAFLWILFFFLPALLRPNNGIMTNFLEHRAYLPMIGLLIVGCELGLISTRINLKNLIAVFVVIGLLSGQTFKHKGHFDNKKSFWENAASTSPHAALAQFNLGVVYYDLGDKNRAEEQFRTTVQLDSMDIASWVNLGTLAMERNDFQDAELYIKKALQINKEYGYAYGQLAELYKRMGKESERQSAQNRANLLGY